jgi:RNA polymerase sigma-70 factor (ECF subfamily)
MTALAQGEREAFHPVFERLWPLLRGFVGRHLPFEDAEDVAQTALVKMFERASEFDPRRDALCWALGIAAWEVRTQRRRRLRRRETSADVLEYQPDEAPSPEDSALCRDLEQALEGALGQLRASDVEALAAFAQDERPTGAAFRKRLERALQRLRRVFAT